ncbi:MAG: hypothetical protein V3V74_07770 [Nitrosomonadaceae bacterium]
MGNLNQKEKIERLELQLADSWKDLEDMCRQLNAVNRMFGIEVENTYARAFRDRLKALDKFMLPCSACAGGMMVATLKRYGNGLLFECLECGEGVISGRGGRLTDAYAELRKKKGQDACHVAACDRPGETAVVLPVMVCWKHKK